jgi:NADPH:quinone reductase
MRAVVYDRTGGPEFTLPVRAGMSTNARWQFVLLYPAPAGLLTHFPLDHAADAHAAVESGAVGKVLIDVAD